MGADEFRGPGGPHQGPDGVLLRVGGARRAQSGPGGDQRGEPGVGAEPLVDGVRVGVQVEQPSQPLYGGGEVARVGEAQPGVQPAAGVHGRGTSRVLGPLVDGDDPGAVRQAQRTAVGAGAGRTAHLLHAGHGLAGQQVEHRSGRVGAAVGQPQGDAGGRGGRPRCAAHGGPQLGRGGRVHGPYGVVELAHAGEPGRERDLRHRQSGGLEQGPRGVGALGPGERDGAGAQFGGELPLHLAGAVPEPHGEPGDALPVHDTVPDQPHGPAHDIGPHVPVGGPGNGVRPTPPTGPEPRPLRGGGRREEPHVRPLGRHGGAARPTVDPGRRDREEELPVEPSIPTPHGLVPAVQLRHGTQSSPPRGMVLAEIGRGGGGGTDCCQRGGVGLHSPRPRFASPAARPSARLRFQSWRMSARRRASDLATIHWFSRTSLR